MRPTITSTSTAMENEPSSRRNRLMGKLFGRDKKDSKSHGVAPGNGDLNDFFHGSSDHLQVNHPVPPMLAKLDTTNARRYPNALDINPAPQTNLPYRERSRSPRIRNKKGLVVRFVETFPEIIGDGGDECPIPTVEIGKRRRAQSAPPPPQFTMPVESTTRERALSEAPHDDFVPQPLRRTQTGYSSIAEHPTEDVNVPALPAGNPTPSEFLDASVTSTDEKRKSFIEIHQAEQRQAEGMAFAKAVRSASASSEREWEEMKGKVVSSGSPAESHASTIQSTVPESAEARYTRPPVEQSPSSSVYSTSTTSGPPGSAVVPGPPPAQRFPSIRERPRQLDTTPSPTKRTAGLPDGLATGGDDSLEIFTARTRHLFELFRLHAETAKPVLSCLPEDLARASLWWFLKGRIALEASMREQPQTPQGRAQKDAFRQQSYADLAKSLWLLDEAMPEVMAAKRSPVDAEAQEAKQAIMSHLLKLTMSMKRNGILPPEDALLPQVIDKSIWVEYPPVSQDIVALLWGSHSSLAAPVAPMSLLQALPLSDTADAFCFGRYSVDAFLIEQNIESQQFHFPCFLSVTRSPKMSNLDFCLASQNGAVQLHIQSSKKHGPTWEDVRWRAETCSLEIKLPRGFAFLVQCTQQDFKILWSMQDFSAKALGMLHPRKDEITIFTATLRGFQNFDANPQTTSFPKEQVRNPDVCLFEKILREGAATGPRNHHRGYRLAIVTGPGTRMLSAVNHIYVPQIPLQFGFLRADNNDPALLLKFDDGNSAGRMVMSFNDENERLRFHSLLLGTAVQPDEKVYSEVPITKFSISGSLSSEPVQGFTKQPWSRARIINEETGEAPSVVLAEKLRVVVDFKNGTITDRVNVAPGELKIRLHVKDNKSLSVLRQPQRDTTIAVSESQVSKETAEDMFQALQLVQGSQTVRTYTFTSLRDLHDFQEALTGYRVLFDGIATSFAISRRRMVVPIYKKWEAGSTRIQVVQMDNIIQVLVFFEDFHHGESMSLTLKPTDVFESFSRSGKPGIRFDDAKFPLPKVADNHDSAPPEDAAFVCLDLPEIPGEHDDISIMFEREEDRDELARSLPAPVKGSRLSRKF